jgi:hypothetical protein
MGAVGQHEVPNGAEQRVEPVSAGRRASERAKPCGEMRSTARDLLDDGSARNGWKADVWATLTCDMVRRLSRH